ncbi:hypothetical protein GCM10010988_32710 [Cnuibacter physcomitrellae]|uniref:Uncharacterized protein n=1 Tax=Cnuibacter physcomitrellae TaxID=1619308 RepID=A0A1X9LH22_9MICO|nr:hypothetical protein [Cnuibacter physcomitrellae]ARJ04484.1 hypothetical protein B5808_04025 [Cnuibacter physcomitrellae]GGI41162.1 hypothetical protein GCM10010988_32710 [Cnuibacter physcomitrellae]
MSRPASETITEYAARRILLETPTPYRDLQSRLDEGVTPLDDTDLAELDSGRTTWADFLRGLTWTAPSGFVRLWRHEAGSLLRHSGSGIETTSYLLADLAVTARALRQDGGALLYLPVRLELQSRPDGSALLMDQPSSALGSFGRNKLTQAGAELDRRLGDLIESLELPRPDSLRR